MHKKLTFSEFYGNSYETEVSHKFIEYLKLCFRAYIVLSLSIYFYLQITSARESRQQYTLDQLPDTSVALPLPSTAPAIAVPQPMIPIVPTPKTSSAPVPGSTGPIRTARVTRPRPTRIKKCVPANAASPTNANTPQVEAPNVRSPQVNISRVHTNTPQANATPFEPDAPPTTITRIEPDAPTTTIAPTEPNVSAVAVTPTEPDVIPVLTATPPDGTSLPATEAPDDNDSASMSYTSTLPDVFDVGMDDSAPPATGPWMIIDHFTGEMIVDDDQSIPPAPTVPNIPTGISLAGVEVATVPRLGTTYLVERPPTLLSEDEDVRPQWLTTAVNAFLRFVPYVGNLGKVVDLYLAQEARLGYPDLVCSFVPFPYNSCSDDSSLLASHFHLETGPPRLPRL